MKIKASTIVLLLSAYCIAIENSWLLMFGVADKRLLYIKQAIYIILFIYCRFRKNAYQKIKPYIKRIDPFILVTFIFIIFLIIYSVIFRDISLGEACDEAFLNYTKFLFVYPLLYLCEKYSLKKILQFFLVIILIPLVYETIAALAYNFLGRIVNTSIIDVEKLRIRNGLVRINTLPLSWAIVVIGFAYSLYAKKKRVLANAIWIITTIIIVIINQSRNLYIAIIISIIIMILFKEKKGKKRVAAALIVCIGVVLLFQTGLVNDFIASFAKNTEGDTISGRMKDLSVLYPMFVSHPVLGFGLIGSTIEYASDTIYFIDFGIAGDYMQMGIFAIFVYGWTIYILVRNTIKLNVKKGFAFTVNSGILTFVIVGLIGYTLFQDTRNFALPCIWAIVEYTYNKQKNINFLQFGGPKNENSTS